MVGETRNVVGIICMSPARNRINWSAKNGKNILLKLLSKNEFITFSGRYGKLPWTEGGFTLQTCPRRCRCQHGWASPKCSRYHSYITYALLERETPRGPENDNFCLLSVLYLCLHWRTHISDVWFYRRGLKWPKKSNLRGGGSKMTKENRTSCMYVPKEGKGVKNTWKCAYIIYGWAPLSSWRQA